MKGIATYWCVKTIQCPPWNMYVPLVDILSRSSHLWMPRIWVVGTWSEASRVFYICFDLPLCVPEGDPRIPDDGSCIRHLDLLVSFFLFDKLDTFYSLKHLDYICEK